MISIRCNRGCVLAGAKRGVVSTPAAAEFGESPVKSLFGLIGQWLFLFCPSKL